jgi:hypothetical protein
MPLDGGLGITAAVAIGSKFVQWSQFPARHDAVYDKELDKSLKTAESFKKIPEEDVDFFEAEEYSLRHSRCGANLGTSTGLIRILSLDRCKVWRLTEASKMNTRKWSGIVHLDRSIISVEGSEKPREMSNLMFHKNEAMSTCVS